MKSEKNKSNTLLLLLHVPEKRQGK